jgi:DNA-binding NtrC family response regulator
VPTGRAIDVSPAASNGDYADDDEDEGSTVVYRPGTTMAELEKEAITAALRQVAGNRRKAAEMLGMGERTLYRKIKEYGIPL